MRVSTWWIAKITLSLFVSRFDDMILFSLNRIAILNPEIKEKIFILLLESLCVLLIILYRTLFSASEIGKCLTLCNRVMNPFTLHLIIYSVPFVENIYQQFYALILMIFTL
jgi:hypothetical protein